MIRAVLVASAVSVAWGVLVNVLVGRLTSRASVAVFVCESPRVAFGVRDGVRVCVTVKVKVGARVFVMVGVRLWVVVAVMVTVFVTEGVGVMLGRGVFVNVGANVLMI